MSNHNIIWKDISDNDFYTFEDPITGSHVGIHEYAEIYGLFLETLDGHNSKSYVDHFFAISPIMNFHWEFADGNVKNTFYQICQKMNLIPELTAVHQGTWQEEDQLKEPISLSEALFQIKQNKKNKPSCKKVINAHQLSVSIQHPSFDLEKIKDQNNIKHQNNIKQVLSSDQKAAKIHASRLISIEKLTNQFEKENNSFKRDKLQAKIVKIKRQIAGN